MNILFVNYGDFTTNSLNHISGFANWLVAEGHACIVAVPHSLETQTAIRHPRYAAALYADVLDGRVTFPDGQPADVLHAWTPRESVRRFILSHQRRHPATRVVVHLEDNEDCLTAAFARRPLAELAGLGDDELEVVLAGALSHPRRHRSLLRVADGHTFIVDTLQQHAVGGAPGLRLEPGVDFSAYHPQAAEVTRRRRLGVADTDRLIVYTGSTTFANADAMRELVHAVGRLNEAGTATHLVRTGFHPEIFATDYDPRWRHWTRDVGFIEKAKLPGLLALADVLVQPGHAGEFDDFRLPSKLPEFLAMGRPVILPATNLGLDLRDGSDALLLRTGDAAEIAERCQQVFADPQLARQLGDRAAAFARQRFDPDQIGRKLVEHYRAILDRPARSDWSLLATPGATESSLLPGVLRRTMAEADAPTAETAAALGEIEALLAQADALAHRGPARIVAAKLEAEIKAARDRAELAASHAGNLEASLHETRQEIARLEQGVAGLHRLYQIYQAELDLTADVQQRLQNEIKAGQDKIRRLQSTFSWTFTAPLRALRRHLVDPFRRPAPPPVAPATALPPLPEGLKFRVDEPSFRQAPAGPLTVRGWCLFPDATPAAAVRVRTGSLTIDGTTGIERRDVSAVHGDGPASHSGFAVDLVLEAGEHALGLEVSDHAGHWLQLWQTRLRVFAPSLPPAVSSYEQWLHLYEESGPVAARNLRERLRAVAQPPLISILMPVFNTPEPWLRRAVASVQAQVYDRWELCIADDASPAPHVAVVLAELAAADPRIKVERRDQNGHISHASNSALELATGDYIGLLDHDDELSPLALGEMVLALARRPDAVLLYSDEDKIDDKGRRFAPYFKPDFLPDLFRAQNYLTHFAVYRAAALGAAGAFRPGYEGSQDWDLALRVTENVRPEQIVHVPKVLYHWRAIPGSTALTLDQKNYHADAARRALQDHLQRTGTGGTLTPVEGGHWRIIPPLPSPAPLVSIIIPTRNGLHHLQRCVGSLREKTTYAPYEVIIVDNGSDDPATLAYLERLAGDGIRVLEWAAAFNYSAINNYAVRQARGEVLVLLNNDIEILTPGWLEEMVGHALRPEIGCVGAMLYYPDNLIQHAGIVLGVGGVAGHAFKKFPRGHEGAFNRARLVQNYSAVTAACLAIRKSTYHAVGGLDEAELAVAFNDVDFCLKVRAAGFRNLWSPFAEFYHHESASRGQEDTPEKQRRFRSEIGCMLRRWGPILGQDPAYNPNLSLESEDFALACPPRALAGAGEPAPRS